MNNEEVANEIVSCLASYGIDGYKMRCDRQSRLGEKPEDFISGLSRCDVVFVIGNYCGRMLVIKLRTELGDLKRQQFLNSVNDNGGIAFIASSANEVRANLAKVLREALTKKQV